MNSILVHKNYMIPKEFFDFIDEHLCDYSDGTYLVDIKNTEFGSKEKLENYLDLIAPRQFKIQKENGAYTALKSTTFALDTQGQLFPCEFIDLIENVMQLKYHDKGLMTFTLDRNNDILGAHTLDVHFQAICINVNQHRYTSIEVTEVK